MAERIPTTIRLDTKTYHDARIAAVVEDKSIGEWLEEAIRIKIYLELHPEVAFRVESMADNPVEFESWRHRVAAGTFRCLCKACTSG